MKKIKEINIGDVIDLKDHEHTILRSHVIFNDVGTIVKIEKNKSNQVEYVHVKLKNKNATPKTPALNKEKPICPGNIKSMVL